MPTKNIFKGNTLMSVSGSNLFYCECYIYVPDNSNNQINLSQLNFIDIDIDVPSGTFGIITSTPFLKTSLLDTWIKLTKVIQTSNDFKAGIRIDSTISGTNIEGFIDSFSVQGPLITRDLPYAGWESNKAINKISKIESKVIEKLLESSGKEKITVPIEGYVNENTLFKFGEKMYIVGSQTIDEFTDTNELQLLQI